MTKLRLAPNLSLPDDAVTQRLAFVGRPGSGKSYMATKLAELLYDVGAQFVALDPVGIWYGVRADGTGKGINVPVFGGLHGDVPLEPTAGAFIADLIVDRGLSCVLDVSQFATDADKARFAAAFAERFYFRKKAAPSAVLLFLEECQEFVPQNPQRGEEHMLHHFTRMAKLGRNFGIGIALITQRPQEVNKKVLNLTECLFAFQMTGVHERKAIRDWVSSKGADEDIVAILPTLKIGVAHVYSPQWLNVSEQVKAYEKRSADVSSTPTLGAATRAESKPLAASELAALTKAMAATIEKAKQEDPKELRREIADLRRQLAQAGKAAPARVVGDVSHATMVSQIDAAVRATNQAHEKRYDGLLLAYRRLLKNLRDVAKVLSSTAGGLTATLETYEDAAVRSEAERGAAGGSGAVRRATRDGGSVVWRQDPPVVTKTPPRERTVTAPTEGLAPSEQKILDALALMASINSPGKRVNLAFFAGYSEGGRFNNLVGGLRTKGLVDYPQDGYVGLTEAGRAVAHADAHPIRSVDDLHELWLTKLPGSEAKVLQAVLEAYPNAITRDELGRRTDYSPGGRFNNIVGKLRTLGALDYPSDGMVRATDALFPEGLD